MSQVFRPFEPMVIVTADNGDPSIPASTPLTRLHYFDGKFLRAGDLSLEQRYLQALTHLANQASGSGVVHGFDTELSDDRTEVVIGAGMAIDPQGRILLLPSGTHRFEIARLIPLTARLPLPSRRRYVGPGSFEECVTTTADAPAVRPTEGYSFYLITIGHAEALCGNEDVYGKICEEACITSTDRPYYREGIIVRAEPMVLSAPLPNSGAVNLQEAHLRSRLASAAFAMEDAEVGALISAAGLKSHGWCLGARLGGGTRVPLAVIARMGTTTLFLDTWTVRRERIDGPPRRYWAARMSMRPWDVFLAQVLQFQCHLTELFDDTPRGGPIDPCRDLRDVVRDTVHTIGDLVGTIKKPIPVLGAPAAPLPVPLTKIADLHGRLDKFIKPGIFMRPQRNGMLIDGGIIELPPAGYLPVSEGQVVNDQIVAMLGRGLDLRYCVVTPDFVAHALEEAQHMDRISLLEGLEPGATRPPVDILIPDGELLKPVIPARGIGFEGELYVRPETAAAPPPVAVPEPAPAPAPAPGPGRVVVEPLPAPVFDPRRPIHHAAMRSVGSFDIANISDRIRETVDDITGRLREIEILEPAKPRPTANVVQVLGAGRGERTGAGGGAFHFAGISEASHKLKVADLIKGLGAIGRDAPDDLKILHKLPVETIDGPAGKVPSTLFMRANTIGGHAALFNSGLKSEFGGGIEDMIRPDFTDLPGFEAPTAPAEKRLVSVWTSMRSERNPFDLVEDESTFVDLNVTVGVPGAKASWIDYRVQGQLTVAAIQRSGPITIVRGFVQGGSAQTRSVIEGGAPSDYFDRGDIAVSCQLEQSVKGQKLTVRVRHGKSNVFRVDLSWGGVPLQAHVEVTYDRVGELADTVLLSGTLLRNDAVLTAGHPRHALAQSAVSVTGALLKQPEFANKATALLFPPAPPPPKDVRIRATRDWVLFHRRRIKNCAVVEAVAPAPRRRYQLWQVEVPDAAAVEKLRTALLTNNPAGLPAFAPITPVEFAGGVATLLSNPDNIRHDWAQGAHGNILQYSLIASHGLLDGDQIARARLAQVQATLQPGVMPDARTVTDVVPFVPGALSVPDTDGAILLVTRSQAKTTCHNVYRVFPHYAEQAQQLLKDHQITALANQRYVSFLGKLEFKGDSADITTPPAERQQLVNQWKAVGDGRIDRVLAFTNAADAVASGEPHLTNRVKAIAGMLGTVEGSIIPGAIAAPMPEGCAGATFVIPLTTRHLVLAAETAAVTLGSVREFMQPSAAPITNAAGTLAGLKRLGEIRFVAGTGIAIDGDLHELTTVLPGATAAQAIVLSRADNGPEVELVLQDQAARIASGIGVPALAATIAPNAPATLWQGSDVRHITIVVAKTQQVTEHLVVAINDNEAIAGGVQAALDHGELNGIIKNGSVLGVAPFIHGTMNTPVPLQLTPLPTASTMPLITRVHATVFTKPGETADVAATSQVDVIGQAIGSAGMTSEVSAVVPADAQWPGDMLHVTVVVVTRPRIGVFTPGVITRLPDRDVRDIVDRIVEAPGVVTPRQPVIRGVPQGGRRRARKTPKPPEKPDK